MHVNQISDIEILEKYFHFQCELLFENRKWLWYMEIFSKLHNKDHFKRVTIYVITDLKISNSLYNIFNTYKVFNVFLITKYYDIDTAVTLF